MRTLLGTIILPNVEGTAWHVETHVERTQQLAFIEEILLLLKRFTKDLLI